MELRNYTLFFEIISVSYARLLLRDRDDITFARGRLNKGRKSNFIFAQIDKFIKYCCVIICIQM